MTTLVKHKAKLAWGLPNSFLFCPGIYALIDIEQAQDQALITTLQKGLNHPNFGSSYLKIRLQQIQDASNSNTSVLLESPLLPLNQLHTYTAQAILAMHKLNISYCNPQYEWPIITKKLGTLIDQIIDLHPKKAYLKEKLNKLNITSIEQFLNLDNRELLN